VHHRHKRGFTLSETLISIAVLAIALTGVLAALAYDVTSAEQNGAHSFANSYNRKVLDLIQTNQIAFDQICLVGQQPAPLNGALDGTTWKALDAGVLANPTGVSNFWGQGADLVRWDTNKTRFHTNMVANRLMPNYTGQPFQVRFQNLLVEVVITTRWPNKGQWRSSQLRAYHSTGEQP
jgi:prepilin-type N-terminal cleavage/methylation domain-containing protein